MMKKGQVNDTKQSYSLRKYKFGLASVILGSFIMVTSPVFADQTTSVQVNNQTGTSVDANNSSNETSASSVITSNNDSVQASDKVVNSQNTATKDITTPLVETKPMVEKTLPEQGNYVYSKETEVKNTPSKSAPVAFYAKKGDKVFYDQVFNKDNVKWISYKSFCGVRRYAAIESLDPSGGSETKAPTPVTNSGSNNQEKIATQGNYTFSHKVEVKNEAKVASPTQFTLDKGDRIFYDQILTIEGNQWLSYKSFNGVRRFVLLGKASSVEKTEDKEKVSPQPQARITKTGRLTIYNETTTGFDILITNIKDDNGIAAVKVPVWTEQGGQDDIKWYTAVTTGDGNYKVAVSFADHKNEKGLYNIHLYYQEASGTLVGVTGTKVTVAGTNSSQEPIENGLAKTGVYNIIGSTEVKNEAKISSQTQFTLEKGDKINYDQVLTADGYQWISYKSYSGVRRYIPVKKLTTSSEKAKDEATKPTSYPNLPKTGTYTFTKTVDVKSQPKVSSPVEFNFQKGEKIHYDQVLVVDGHQWISYKSYSGIRRYIEI
ncbi:TPA: SH3 domain-containing protein [Streptococcus agalactiae]|uniref:SH3 domain-containing protein n=1 Tax=Streptococcus agalactiae TaxID=1311 RepID=UPI0002BB3EB4|nr:SH3 domain-containing protein [Streptococcus agalactiae]EPU66719.1 choline binding protein D [Streptococcus agalactiae GB00084]KAA8960382.1 YSIRK-type signal peptide-containing protein [Streptococcus agalactiae]KAA8967992.1 YSIRK-type signal peptide-containing protein [Streptococcus agalactiae]KAA8981054.1 YSIRK-type signal peptide-containing protein [Streptococcus agalactiae]KAA8991370.1 YSIRK-type signal peptide-containing protein [Streptococcus agalactiae]